MCKKMIKLFLLFIIFFCPIFGENQNPLNRLTIHIFCEANGKGLEKDRIILTENLRNLNCKVICFSAKDVAPKTPADINIFVQQIDKRYLHFAKKNWFIPNPEWYLDGVSLLNSIDLILCRTKEVQRIFNNLNCSTYFLSFTSNDHRQKQVKKDFSKYLHLAGSSSQKGTVAIKTTWKKKPRFPYLTIVKHRSRNYETRNLKVINQFIPEKEVLKLQNESGVHLCLSETEGFGHYIMEAMSSGAVVLTTNAPPMNEFIQDKRFLVPYKRVSIQRLGTNYYVESSAIEKKIKALQKIPKEELKAIGKANRRRYLEIHQEFLNNLKVLIEKTKQELIN